VLAECGKQLVIAKKGSQPAHTLRRADLGLPRHAKSTLEWQYIRYRQGVWIEFVDPKSHFPSVFNFKDTGIRSTFENYNSLLEGCKKYLRAAVYQVKKQDLHSGSDPDANWLGKILAKRAEVDPSLLLKAEIDCLPESTNNIYNKEVKESGLRSNFGDFS
jgi:hypothetical protein